MTWPLLACAGLALFAAALFVVDWWMLRTTKKYLDEAERLMDAAVDALEAINKLNDIAHARDRSYLN